MNRLMTEVQDRLLAAGVPAEVAPRAVQALMTLTDGWARLADSFGRELSALMDQQRLSEENARLKASNTQLARLQTATFCMRASSGREEVLQAIQEIVFNVVGSEEVAIYEPDAEAKRLKLIASTGVDAGAMGEVPVGEGPIGEVAASRQARVSHERTPEVAACVPVTFRNELLAVVAIFRLLPQKRQLDAADTNLLEHLATEAAAALMLERLSTSDEAAAGIGAA